MHAIGHFTLGALASLTLASANAQSTALPAETNVRGADTPRIHPDGAITFTLNAPAANTVLVAGGDGLGKGPFAMVKGPRSLWSVTSGSLQILSLQHRSQLDQSPANLRLIKGSKPHEYSSWIGALERIAIQRDDFHAARRQLIHSRARSNAARYVPFSLQAFEHADDRSAGKPMLRGKVSRCR